MRRLFWIVIAALAACTSAATGRRDCPALPDGERVRLIDYVRKKNKLAPAMPLSLTEISTIGTTCYRKVEFKSTDSKRAWRIEMYLSPDFRFLSRELLDSTIDPVLEERRRRQALSAGLITGNFPALGPRNAKVTLVLFSDFQCPYCARMARMLRTEILPAEKTTRLIFRNFPLGGHSWARPAAEAAACAQEQGVEHFWRLHDFIFEQQTILNSENLLRRLTDQTAHYSLFDQARFKTCLTARRTSAMVDADVAFATQNGIGGTPTLFINGEQAPAITIPEQLRTLIRQASATPSNARRDPREKSAESYPSTTTNN